MPPQLETRLRALLQTHQRKEWSAVLSGRQLVHTSVLGHFMIRVPKIRMRAVG